MRLSPADGAPPPGGAGASVLAAARLALDGAGTILAPDPGVGAALQAAGFDVVVAQLAAPPRGIDAVALLADELSTAGEHAESLIDAAVAVVRPGGWIVATARSAVHAPADDSAGRSYTAEELQRALGHHGIAVELLCAPGAAALVRGEPGDRFDPLLDRLPGLADAAPRILAAGRSARSSLQRSEAFFATLPYKVVAASVICRDGDGRLLIVHDSFKGHWTIPGGVVDADEDPRSGAVREVWEEAGVRVLAGVVLGVFSASWPDRIVLVYEATPVTGAEHRHRPVHAHEIDDVAWVPLERALQMLAPHVAEQARHCLDHPGGTLRQHRA